MFSKGFPLDQKKFVCIVQNCNSTVRKIKPEDAGMKWGIDRVWATFGRLNCCCDEPLLLHHWHPVLLHQMGACNNWSTYTWHVRVISVAHFHSAHPPSTGSSFSDSNVSQFTYRSFIQASWLLLAIFLPSFCKKDLAPQMHRLKPYNDKNFNFASGLEAPKMPIHHFFYWTVFQASSRMHLQIFSSNRLIMWAVASAQKQKYCFWLATPDNGNGSQ